MTRLFLLSMLLVASFACKEAPGDVAEGSEPIYPAPTGWAASTPVTDTGNISVDFWVPVGRTVSLYKLSDASRLKVTVSDTFRAALNTSGGSGSYEVRVNGGEMIPRCLQAKYYENASDLANGDFHHPFATVCVADPLPRGLYEFEVWVQATSGWAFVGANLGQSLLLAEEMPTDDSYAMAPLPADTFEMTTGPGTTAGAPFRQIAYAKKSASTLLKVTLADTLSTGINVDGGTGSVMVRMDGSTTTPCRASKADWQTIDAEFRDPFVLTCILEGIAVGSHTFNVWLSSSAIGSSPDSSANLGWGRSYPLLLVEELPATGRSFVATATDTGEIEITDSSVVQRTLTHTVSADGTAVKLTYSDNFRGALSCARGMGLVLIYLDGTPTNCTIGQYSYLNDYAQNHHRPLNLTCVFRDLPAGPHTFDVHVAGNCGTSNLGWQTAQNLLLVEDLP